MKTGQNRRIRAVTGVRKWVPGLVHDDDDDYGDGDEFHDHDHPDTRQAEGHKTVWAFLKEAANDRGGKALEGLRSDRG